MRTLHVASNGDVIRLAAAVTLVALSVVTLIMVLVFPTSDWSRQIMFAWPTTIIIAFGTIWLLGQQLLRIHDLNTELQRLVSRDRLTDVATRDFFFTRLAERPDSYGVSLMVDIDSFKLVNDTYGHLAGDQVIMRVARILEQEVGARDIVCRFGGEEFVIFLDDATQTIALDVSERIRARVESTPLDGEGNSVFVTVSIGGSLRMAAEKIEEAIRQADAALYRAKQMGRNQVAMYSDLPEMADAAEGHSKVIRSVPRASEGRPRT